MDALSISKMNILPNLNSIADNGSLGVLASGVTACALQAGPPASNAVVAAFTMLAVYVGASTLGDLWDSNKKPPQTIPERPVAAPLGKKPLAPRR